MALTLGWEEPCLLEMCPHLPGLWGRFKERNKATRQDGNSATASAKRLDSIVGSGGLYTVL